jgi:peptidoglycan hydrolase-like protein with peptidoglycan-binding domain
MRVLILAFSLLAVLVSTNLAKAGPSTTSRDVSVDPAIFSDEATQQTEDQIGLDKGKRRDVQRRLTRLGFDTKINGKFDEPTRTVIMRWQSARGYPRTGFLNTPQHQALRTESAGTAQARLRNGDKSDDAGPARRRGGGSARHSRNGGGPVRLIGGVVGGLFR